MTTSTESTPIAPATLRSTSYSTTPSTATATTTSIDAPQQSSSNDAGKDYFPHSRSIACGNMAEPRPGEAPSSNGRQNNGSGAGASGAAGGTPKLGWLKRMGSIELENKGSVARDHLALERTFLAWLRTSLAFASIGIAITQLFRLNSSSTSPSSSTTSSSSISSDPTNLGHIGKPLGATFLGIAILVLFLGINRYYESQAWLLKGKFPASRGSVMVLTLVAGGLITASFGVIIGVGKGWET